MSREMDEQECMYLRMKFKMFQFVPQISPGQSGSTFYLHHGGVNPVTAGILLT